MTEHQIKIFFKEYQSLKELKQPDYDLCLEAVKAMGTSHSPYSKFRVGTALRLQSGKIVYGSNQENVAYPSGLCAERVALFHCGAYYPDDPIEAMAVTARSDEFEILQPVASCGACLQVMAEYEKKQNKPIKIILFCNGGPAWVMGSVESLLPFLFFENRLKAKS
ncbi:MAG TPA: cytidine deaminase [Mucilaginibacter sp.]|jgi:cytidine deaminase